MEAYANALLYAIPFFMLLLFIELAYGYFRKDIKHRYMDTISSLSSGLTNIIKDSLGLVIVIVSYPFFLKYLAVIELPNNWLVYVVAFIAIDFASYWNHRLNHKVNFFWNQHVIHHSSEEFNLACALRQPISNVLGYYGIFLIPAAFFGVPHKVISVLAPIHLFAQFWYHTQYIGKLGILEYIFVTPSQHRVHHAINPEYIDKNLAAIFCVWDRAFGTFQEELDDVPPVYGILKPANTWNPILINFQHLWRLCVDAWHTKSWKDKFRLWLMPTGWRPKDVAKHYPKPIITDPYNLNKYRTHPSKALTNWSVFQFFAILVLLLFMFYNYGNIGFSNLLLNGFILFLGIYTYTSLMDKSKHAIFTGIAFTFLGLFVILKTGDWFGLNSYINYGSYVIALFLMFTLVVTLRFSLKRSLIDGH